MASVTKRQWTTPGGGTKEAWVVRYKDTTGSYRQSTFKRKKEADAYRTTVESELANREHIAGSQRKTISFVANAYITEIDQAAKRGVMRRSTVAQYIQRIEALVLPRLGERFINEVEVFDVEKWIGDLRREGYAPKTVSNSISLLKLIIDFAIRYKWARVNPVVSVPRSVRAAKTEPIRQFTVDDVRALLAAAGQRYHKSKRRPTATLQCFVSLAAFLGLRWGEIAGLQAKNLDLDAGILRVRTSLGRVHLGRELNDPKTKAGRRDIRLPSTMLALLRAYVADFPPDDPDSLVFQTCHGLPIGYASWWTKSWSKLLERAGLKGGQSFHFHALRHFAASWMIENGWPLPDVSAQLGHANVNITMQVYAHSIEKRAQSLEAMDALADRLTGAEIVPVAPSQHAKHLRIGNASSVITL
ncbi:tyrosine-type recombinase/integrase [Sphingomonas fuzhouensis]|uniref:tyrosine-type recombinase/integrase n=1 Tax=Sphingomonas fuzhouensis TaxID=3106033 RepID=UPI002AFFE2DA|nr:site-specific integrase [Sphingomonas sp. SGZ-02]